MLVLALAPVLALVRVLVLVQALILILALVPSPIARLVEARHRGSPLPSAPTTVPVGVEF